MDIIPENNTVLCEVVTPEFGYSNIGNLHIKTKELPLYRIIKDSTAGVDFQVGDIILCNSTGTKVKAGSKTVYLFKRENIVGKIADEEN